MRLTNSIMTKNYLNSLNKSLSEMSNTNTLIAAKRKYMHFSDDPANAMRAMKVRVGITRVDVYTENLLDAKDILSQYESTISNINTLMSEAVAQVFQGMTGTSDENVRKAVASALRGFQDSILAAANAQFASDYIFGGDSVGNKPFTVDEDGKLMYKGQPVDTGTFVEEERYIDIGIGLEFDGGGEVVPVSAMNIALSGANLLGTGVDGDGITKNIYNMLGILAEKFENNDMTDIDTYYEKLQGMADNIRIQYVSIGERSNYITFFTERLETEQNNLLVKQNRLESLDLAEGITAFGEQELAYNACLQMGSKILQPSLLDFLR